MQLVHEIVNIVLPVFLVIALGYALRTAKLLGADTVSRFSWFIFYVSAPALLFRGAATTPLSKAIDLRTLGSVYAVSIVLAFAVYMLGFRLVSARRGVVSQGVFRSNMVFVGLPVVTNAFGEAILGPISVLIGFTVPLYNLLAVIVLTIPHNNHGEGLSLTRTLRDILLNPLILACAAGLLFSGFSLELPKSLDRSFELVGRIAMPLALVVVGASLDLKRLSHQLMPASLVSLLKLVLYPGLIFLLLNALGSTGPDMQAAVLLMATPAAVASHIMASEMRGDPELSSSVVIASTLYSLVSMSAWIALLKWLG